MTQAMWQPKNPSATAMWRFMQFAAEKHHEKFTNYSELHQWSVANPAAFWSSLCDFFSITFDTPAQQILNDYKELHDARWFFGAKLNYAEKLLQRKDEHPALICINENNDRQVITYKELYSQVAQCAAGLKKAGVQIGDSVVGVLPNTQYAIIAALATISLGAIWSSCSSDFGAQAIIDRFGQINPKVLFICEGHQYQGKFHSAQDKLHELMAGLPSVQEFVVCPKNWDSFLQPATECSFASVPFDHPIYILFSSGTTGKPKCIVHSAGGTLIQHIKELGLHSDLNDKDILCFYTTCGWMMWNWSVSVLALGTTMILYEGSPTYPQTNSLFNILEQEKVSVFGTSAKYISAIDKAGIKPKDEFKLASLRCILSTGSPLLPKNFDYVYTNIKQDLQLSSISGGTDIVSCFALGNPILPVYKGELQCAGLGMAVTIYNEQGQTVQQERGELVCTKPFPSMPIGFWHDEDKKAYKKAYFSRFPGVWAQGDFAEYTQHAGFIIYGRSDAVLNPGGVRIGTAEIYKLVEQVEEVVDSIVIGQDWQDDVRVVLFVQLRSGLELSEELQEKIRLIIRKNASPRHVPAKILQVGDIPKTMSGKIVEVAVKQIVQGQEIPNLQSLINPKALDYFRNRPELSSN
ncbi:MAG: acetoacetate--CoA ligase [Legionella sp.]|jgi:acetoacetyl-CoA synthetase